MVQFSRNYACKECMQKSFLMLKMTQEEMEEINKTRIEVKFRKGDIICKQHSVPTHLIYLVNGYAKMFMEGLTQVTMQIITPGNYIGLQTIFSEEAFVENTYKYSVIALDDSHACFIDINTFKRIVRQNNALSYEILRYLSQNELFLYGRIQTSIQKNSRGRIADTLLYLADITGSNNINLQLTRKDLAELAGTSLENLIRILSELNKENIIRLDGKRIEIINVPLLKKIQELG